MELPKNHFFHLAKAHKENCWQVESFCILSMEDEVLNEGPNSGRL